MSGRMRRVLGAIAGALAAGSGISAMLIAAERRSGEPSELADLGRAAARRLGCPRVSDGAGPDAAEQAAIQGAHLALSAVAGVAYAALFDREASVLGSGTVFGLCFYGAAHWLAGPALGLKAPEWRSGAPTIGVHALNHVGFGIATALGARLASPP